MKYRLIINDLSIGMSGVLRAPQLGLPRMTELKMTAREIRVNERKITPGELEELTRLMKEAS